VIWTAGIKAAPLVEALGVERERDGRVRVNDTFELPNQPGVFVIGDAAAVRPPGSERPLPPTASVAVDEGPFAAENAFRRLHDQQPRTFAYHSRGDLVSLGRGAAAANVLGLVFDGIPAWLVRRTVYLVYLAGLRNRTFVVLDWLFVSFHQRVIASFDGVTHGRLVFPRGAQSDERRRIVAAPDAPNRVKGDVASLFESAPTSPSPRLSPYNSCRYVITERTWFSHALD